MKGKIIAIIGGGNLGTAIAEGLLISGEVKPSQLLVTRRRNELLAGLQQKGVTTGSDNISAVKQADIVLITVKPYQVIEILKTINPFLDEAIRAARRGVRVRVLLDSYYYNTEGPADNDEMVRFINNLAAEENLPLEARLADLEANNIEKIHNKGVIVDGRSVLVSSINWNDNSPRFNRETGVIIDHDGVGEYFSRVFEDDWAASPLSTKKTGPDWFNIGIALTVLFTLCIIAYIKKRTRF